MLYLTSNRLKFMMSSINQKISTHETKQKIQFKIKTNISKLTHTKNEKYGIVSTQ